MKHLWLTLLILTGLSAAVGFVAYRMGSSGPGATQGDALAWLKAEFRLTEEQFSAVRTLHESYATECEEHCRAIMEAADARADLQASPDTDPATLAAADLKVRELRRICETAIAAHVRQVAARMSDEQGRRYLALVLPKIADFDHRGAPDVRVESHSHRH